jgi:hypothetical protein
MFNHLPGAMLTKGDSHQCRKGHNCGRVLSQHIPLSATSHRLFNPVPPEPELAPDTWNPAPGT